mmetsp:Transcript_35099/g.88868  ORF Transcript_35099/g.88868 Transcript_35099/m.88868 type:complete len:262 (-) Transcript_35099:1227-2012(-)
MALSAISQSQPLVLHPPRVTGHSLRFADVARPRRSAPHHAARSQQSRTARLACSASQQEGSSSEAGQPPASSASRPALGNSGMSGITVKGYSPTSMQGWMLVRTALKEAGVKFLSPQEVAFAAERGVPVVDVRPSADYDKGHLPGAKSVPLYQPITGWDPAKVARRVGYALFGVLNGTEVNPNFVRDVLPLIDAEKGVILYCSIGGSLEQVEGSKKGLQSRSVIGAYQLLEAGARGVQIMRGGFLEWEANGRDVEVFVDDV